MYLGIDPAVMDASSGMYAAGQTMTFLLFGGFSALVPTAYLLKILSQFPRFWTFISGFNLLFSLIFFPFLTLIFIMTPQGTAKKTGSIAAAFEGFAFLTLIGH